METQTRTQDRCQTSVQRVREVVHEFCQVRAPKYIQDLGSEDGVLSTFLYLNPAQAPGPKSEHPKYEVFGVLPDAVDTPFRLQTFAWTEKETETGDEGVDTDELVELHMVLKELGPPAVQ